MPGRLCWQPEAPTGTVRLLPLTRLRGFGMSAGVVESYRRHMTIIRQLHHSNCRHHPSLQNRCTWHADKFNWDLAKPCDVDGAVDCRLDVETSMAYQSHVADAMCQLLAGFAMIEKMASTLHAHRQLVTPLDAASKNISLVLENLNECSCALLFWPTGRARTPIGLRKIFRRFMSRNDEKEVPRLKDSRALPISTTTGIATPDSNGTEMDVALAAATLQLVAAYSALEALPGTPFRLAAPRSFGIASCALFTALVNLDECSLGLRAYGVEVRQSRSDIQ